MGNDFFSDENKQKRKEVALLEHTRLHELFRKNRFLFELERKRRIEECIEGADPVAREGMELLQKEIDVMMRGAKTAENRLALMEATLSHHVINKFLPALRSFKK